MNTVQAIKTFFERDGGRPVTMDEMRALSSQDRTELGRLACERLGVPFTPAPGTMAAQAQAPAPGA